MKKFFKTLGFIVGFPLFYYIVLSFVDASYVLYYIMTNKINIHALNPSELMNIIIPVNYKLSLIGDLIFLVILFIIFLFTKEKLIKRCRFHRLSLKNTGLIAITSIGLAFIIILLMQAFSLIFPSLAKDYSVISKSLTSTHNSFIALFGVIVLIPIFEEIFFRGVIFGFLRDNFKFPIALIIQALVFGILHGNLVQGSYAFLLGLFLGIIFYSTDSLFASITAHITYNLFGVLLIPMFFGLAKITSPVIILSISVIIGLATLIFGGKSLSNNLRKQRRIF